MKSSSAGGVLLIFATLVTLLAANSSWSESFHELWEQPFGIVFGVDFQLQMPLHEWINDALMALFFLLVGLELKREILVGELSSIRDAALPIIAAAGGMLVPAAIFTALNAGGPGAAGWGIPTATDIAFAIGVLVLLGDRAPRNMVVFLTALAIADDLGAVLLIAAFYTHSLDLAALGLAAAAFGVLLLLNRGGVRVALPYWVVGIVLWYLILMSGIHATLAGVLLAVAIPARPRKTPDEFDSNLSELHDNFRAQARQPQASTLQNPGMAAVATKVERAAVSVQTPLQHIEHALAPWVTFLVVPLFALANAAVDFRELDIAKSLLEPVTLGIALGLVLGKFIGISAFCWLAVRTGLGVLPSGVNWHHMLGAAWLGGIGFTMSLFISQLAFTDPVLADQAKIGILLASLLAALIGSLWLVLAPQRSSTS